MTHTVIGIFDNQSEAQAAISQLMNNGFTRDYIDVSSQNSGATSSYGGSSSHDSGITDKVSNFFGSMFDSKDDADRYSQVARQGTMVTVHAKSADEASRAADILDQYGAVDLDERSGRSGTAGSRTDTATSGALPVIEEELEVGKRTVETGGVRLRSRIIERPVEENIRLREEHVHVERNAVNRDATAADFANFKEGTIEVTEHAEVPVVAKEARVVEEVRLEKDVEEVQETIRDTVRSTDVEVENLGTGDLDTDRTRMGTAATTAGTGYPNVGQGPTDGTLRRMKDIEDDYEVAHDDEDVRGWDVVGRNGDKIGEVYDMIVDMDAMKVRYLEVDVVSSLQTTNDIRKMLVPVGMADLDHSGNNVVMSELDSSMIANFPPYTGEPITRAYEHSVLTAFSPGYQSLGAQDGDFYDQTYFRNRRSAGSGL